MITRMEVDPDYVGYAVDPQEELQEERARILKENAREAAVEKITSIINEQFDKEIEMKENELMRINQRLTEARCVMDRLRACVVASFYAASFTKPVNGAKGPDPGAAYHPAIQNTLRKAVTTVLSKNAPYTQHQPRKNTTTAADNAKKQEEACALENELSASKNTLHEPESLEDATISPPASTSTLPVTENEETSFENMKGPARNLGGRQRIKKTVIVGNVSKYIPSDRREGSDKSTHKWMVYVRGSKEEPRIDHFVRKVWFFLHPSYRPNDLVEVCEAPFHLTRRGWGEFPIRVQIHFCDRRNRPVDIIHGLRLDRSYTGLQTLGAETVCEVELDRSSIRLNVEEILDVANLPNLALEPEVEPERKATESEDKESLQGEQNPEPLMTDPSMSVDEAQDIGENVPDGVKLSDQNCFQPVTTSCIISSDTLSPSNKRKSDEDEDMSSLQPVEKRKQADVDSSSLKEKEESMEECGSAEKEDSPIFPAKRRRKRRRDDSCRVSASEDDTASESNAKEPTTMETDGGETKDPEISRESVTASCAIDASGKNSEGNATESEERTDSSKSDSSLTTSKETRKCPSSDISATIKQPVVMLSRSPVSSNKVFRMRSASFAEGVQDVSCTSLIKSGVTVTPVLSIKLNTDQGSETPPVMKKVILTSDTCSKTSDPRSFVVTTPIETTTSPSPNFQSVQISTSTMKPTVPSTGMPQLAKKDSGHPSHIKIPLSALLKPGMSLSQTQILKVSNQTSSSTKTPAFSVNLVNLSSRTAGPQQRQRRSLSDDQSPSRMLSVTPMPGAVARGASSVPLQLHIISPPGSMKKSKTAATQPITLQALQAALAPGTLTLSQETSACQSNSLQKKQTGQPQFVLAAVKGKQQQLTLVPSPSVSGSVKKLFTIVGPGPKDKKSPADSSAKQASVQKAQGGKTGRANSGSHLHSQPEVAAPARLVHEVIGDQIALDVDLRSLVDDILPHVVKRVPLIDEQRDLSRFPFCAQSESDFLDWNVGKQRASEWQRAALIQKVLKYVKEKSESLKECELPSKKFLMTWCLRHGYSVFADEYEAEESENTEDKKETKEEEIADFPQTMTTAKELLELLERMKEEKAKQGTSVADEDEDDVIFVDVVNVDPPARTAPEVKQEPSDTSLEIDLENQGLNTSIQQLMESPEVAAVEEMTRKIGINLHQSSGLPTCHLVLAKALQQFAESLLRKSHSSVLKRRDGGTTYRVAPEAIKVVDIVKAICENSTFDFLTDKYVGSED